MIVVENATRPCGKRPCVDAGTRRDVPPLEVVEIEHPPPGSAAALRRRAAMAVAIDALEAFDHGARDFTDVRARLDALEQEATATGDHEAAELVGRLGAVVLCLEHDGRFDAAVQFEFAVRWTPWPGGAR